METNLSNLAKAIIAVMKEVKGIDKNLTVGSGSNAYKGVADKDVKQAVGEAMANNGLCILPIGIDAKANIERWEETDKYGTKRKTSVLTESKTKYLLLHESGESVVIEGYGHGVDTQDKSAGKATTYALKYMLLYMFMIPTGKIDDADATHSNEITDLPKQEQNQQPKKDEQKPVDNRPWLNEKQFNQAIERIHNGEAGVYEKIDAAFRIAKNYMDQLKSAKPTKTAA